MADKRFNYDYLSEEKQEEIKKNFDKWLNLNKEENEKQWIQHKIQDKERIFQGAESKGIMDREFINYERSHGRSHSKKEKENNSIHN